MSDKIKVGFILGRHRMKSEKPGTVYVYTKCKVGDKQKESEKVS